LQGEREFASDNQLLGRLNPMDISPAPRNAPKIEVIFSIDANGILSVSAKDMATGREQSIEIKGASGLSKTEIERMKKNAEIHAEYDRKHSELSDLKNQGDALVFQVDKILADQSDGGAEEELGVLRDAIIANEGEVRLATQSLEQTLSKIQSLEQIRCDMNSGQDVGNTMFRYVRKMLDWLGFRHGRNNESHGGD
jgi:molecular chaperone DnaK